MHIVGVGCRHWIVTVPEWVSGLNLAQQQWPRQWAVYLLRQDTRHNDDAVWITWQGWHRWWQWWREWIRRHWKNKNSNWNPPKHLVLYSTLFYIIVFFDDISVIFLSAAPPPPSPFDTAIPLDDSLLEKSLFVIESSADDKNEYECPSSSWSTLYLSNTRKVK